MAHSEIDTWQVCEAAKKAGASRVIGIDSNPDKFALGEEDTLRHFLLANAMREVCCRTGNAKNAEIRKKPAGGGGAGMQQASLVRPNS